MLPKIFKKRFFKKIKLVPFFLMALLGGVGCNGILDCPFDAPSCCYNILFGCDIFEIPEGCSCSQYGLGAAGFSLQTKVLSVKPNKETKKSPSLIGKWEGQLERVSTNCTNTLKVVNGNVNIKRVKKGITIDIPGYGKLLGEENGKRIKAQGVYKVASCRAELSTSLQNKRAGVAKTDVNFKYSCSKGFQCSARYNGVIKKR